MKARKLSIVLSMLVMLVARRCLVVADESVSDTETTLQDHIDENALNPHPPFVEENDLWQTVDGLPAEHQVVKLTGEMYDEMITQRFIGSPKNELPWVLLFANPKNIDDKRAYQHYRKLAAKYEGKVRFAWVDQKGEELLSASFDARFLPQTFLIKDGTAYWYRDFPYDNILERYIEQGRYVNSTTSFSQPSRFIDMQLYLYTYPRKDFRNYYRQHLEFELRRWLAKTFPKSPNLMPKVDQVVNWVYWGGIWAFLCGPSCLYLVFCRFLGRCLCPSKDKGKPSSQIDYKSSSASDVLKKDQ